MTELLTLLLTAILTASAGWWAGHSTARVRHIPISRPVPGCACRDQAELDVADGIRDWHRRDSA